MNQIADHRARCASKERRMVSFGPLDQWEVSGVRANERAKLVRQNERSVAYKWWKAKCVYIIGFVFLLTVLNNQ